jgi:hypothetical protein
MVLARLVAGRPMSALGPARLRVMKGKIVYSEFVSNGAADTYAHELAKQSPGETISVDVSEQGHWRRIGRYEWDPRTNDMRFTAEGFSLTRI